MQIVLTSVPVLTEQTDLNALRVAAAKFLNTPPLGTLTVAALFRTSGYRVSVVDANREYLSFAGDGGDPDGFPGHLAGVLAASNSPLYGFSTICNCYHVTLETARLLKSLCPRARIVLGGPQASATAVHTLRKCSWIDFVLRGEVEGAVGGFVEHHANAPRLVPNLAHRDAHGSVVENKLTRPADLDSAPFPALDLWASGPVTELPIEVGRGCPCNCRFCSTSEFFGRKYRVKSPARIIEEVLHLASPHSPERVLFIHDHLAARRSRVRELCAAWRNSETLAAIPWFCSLRIDDVDEELTELLAGSGCKGGFVGVESGSQRMQKVLGKRLRLERVQPALEMLHNAGISTTVSFIAGLPEETAEDLENTCEAYASVLGMPRAKPILSTLAPLAGTRYGVDHAEALVFDGRFSDIANQGASLSATMAQLVSGSPELYSAHFAIEPAHLDRDRVLASVLFLKHASGSFRWLLCAAVRLSSGINHILAAWWHCQKRNPRLFEPEYYHRLDGFPRDLLAFMSGLVELPEFYAAARGQFLAMIMSDQLRTLPPLLPVGDEVQFLPTPSQGIELTEETWLASGAVSSIVAFQYDELVAAIQAGEPLEAVPPRETLVLTYQTEGEWLTEVASPLTGAIVAHFRRPRQLGLAVRHLRQTSADQFPAGFPVEDAIIHAIVRLLETGILGVAASPESG